MGSASSCTIQGDPDLYGLGIRLGIYFQMLTIQASGLLSYVLRAEDGMGEISVIFVFSVGTILIRKLVSGNIEAVEAMFMIGSLMGLVNSYRSSNQLRGLAQVIYSFELLILIGLYVWFWWHGMDTLHHTCDDSYSFFFAKVSIWGWFRTFNKVLTVFAALAGVMTLVASVVAYGLILWKIIDAWNYRRQQRKLGHNVDPTPPPEFPAVGGVVEIDIALNVGIIVFMELAIRWNSISGVNSLNSAGQFMPFFIALAQFLSVGYKALSNYMRKFATEEFDGQQPGHLEAGDQHNNALSLGPDGQPLCRHGKDMGHVHEEETHSLPPVRQRNIVRVSTDSDD